jgi:hypothetical protein
MTNVEFMNKLDAMYAKHPMIARSNPKSLNELTYVLRMEGDRDYSVSTNNGMCIPSVRETFIPSRDLAKKILSIEWEEFEDEEYGTYGAIFVDLEGGSDEESE